MGLLSIVFLYYLRRVHALKIFLLFFSLELGYWLLRILPLAEGTVLLGNEIDSQPKG